jgi:hypothetical protein
MRKDRGGLVKAGEILQGKGLVPKQTHDPRPIPPTDLVNPQLSLFQNFLCNNDVERLELSNAIDLWDSIPRYSFSRQAMAKIRQARGEESEKGTTLKKYTATVHYMRGEYECTITPARVTDLDGQERDYYPSANEELVEDALRKIAADQAGFFDDSNRPNLISGAFFSLYGLQQELGRVDHSRSCAELRLSLDIMNGSNIKIDGKNERGEELHISSPYLPSLIAVSKGRLKDDPKAKWMVQFHPLVTASIDKIAYRQFNYGKMMRQKTHLARWLHKQLALKWTGADLINSFEIRYSTIKRDSGLLDRYSRERDGIDALAEALTELKDREILYQYERKDILGPRKKILDSVFTIWPSMVFVSEVKAANKRQKDGLQKLEPRGTGRGSVGFARGTGRGSVEE